MRLGNSKLPLTAVGADGRVRKAAASRRFVEGNARGGAPPPIAETATAQPNVGPHTPPTRST
jgi:hypothetical protein